MAEFEKRLAELIERFERNREAYDSPAYNETQLRVEFIDPFFDLDLLGWDVHNEAGYAEAYKDVIYEEAIKVGVATKAPDYSFRIGGTRKFFVEAKKPAENVHRDAAHSYQLRRYAWSAKLPLSVLTNFREFALYDCRIRPQPSDKASAGRVFYCTYEDYPDRWNEITGIISKDAVLRGDFDRYVASARKKRGTAEVDEAFLKEIEQWREMLARNLALRNRKLSVRDLNFAVGRTIDRIIFLRMCEDRGIEHYGQLQALLNGEKTYRRLFELFNRADDRYNSGLFHFHPERDRPEPPDELTPRLKLDDKVLKDVLRGLYYPESPYEFSVLPADVLGQVYEQFLGKVIRLTAGHRARVEEKPEVRKAGGVYYTPTYIVDYIVRQTVGRLLGELPSQAEGSGVRDRGSETKGDGGKSKKLTPGPRPLTPAGVSRLRILDPACGSGSFLVAAYQYLLDWHLNWYTTNDPEKWSRAKNPTIVRIASLISDPRPLIPDPQFPTPGPQPLTPSYRLTTAEKKRILLNNIYGVDIDPQAVEVTKLSLLLKVLEGENRETLERQLKFLHERALPDLASNIKCGNSLIGPDFYEGRQLSFLDDEERYRINAFDWPAEFPQVFRPSGRQTRGQGSGARDQAKDSNTSDPRSPTPDPKTGFDVVIGNPPYIRMEEFKEIKSYLRENYSTHDERTDIYVYFVERAHQLLRRGGRFGMIVSNKFLRANYGQKLRDLLASVATIDRIVDLAGLPVFHGATVRTVVVITTKGGQKSPTLYSPPPDRDGFLTVESGSCDLGELADSLAYQVTPERLTGPVWDLTRVEHAALTNSLREAGQPLVEFVKGRICRGIVSGLTAAFVITQQQRRDILGRNPEAEKIIRPFLQGRDIRQYRINPRDEFLIYTHHGIDMKPYPALIDHLRPFKRRLEARATKQAWYELQQPQFAYVGFFENPKIVFPDIATNCRFTLDLDGYYGANTVYFIPTDDLRLLGLLNSKLAQFYFTQTCAALEGSGEAYLRFFGQYLEAFPVALPKPSDKRRYDSMIELVGEMLTLHNQLSAAKTPDEKTRLHRLITATDRQIDRLVCELYRLTDEEVKLVEEEK